MFKAQYKCQVIIIINIINNDLKNMSESPQIFVFVSYLLKEDLWMTELGGADASE